MPHDDILGVVPVVIESRDSDGGVALGNESDGIVLEIEGVRVLVPARFAPDHLGRVVLTQRFLLSLSR